MRSQRNLNVSKFVDGTGARGEAFVDLRYSDRMWLNNTLGSPFNFFTMTDDGRARVFFHEVTHLTGLVPGDIDDEGQGLLDYEGWHEIGGFYEDLIISRQISDYRLLKSYLELHPATDINHRLEMLEGRPDAIIRRRDGQSLGIGPLRN